jgi:mRNA interferase MazF
VLDQIRTVDKSCLVRRLGKIDKQSQSEVLSVLAEMFAP